MADRTSETRRSFLGFALLFLAGAVTSMGAWGAARFAFFGVGTKRKREFSRDILEKLQPGVPLHAPEAGAWFLKRKKGEKLIVLDDRCTHLGCRQKWNPEKRLYQCPCHGSEFDSQGAVKRGPATRPIPRLYVGKKSKGKLGLVEKPPNVSASSEGAPGYNSPDKARQSRDYG